jgi:hypothetical protein
MPRILPRLEGGRTVKKSRLHPDVAAGIVALAQNEDKTEARIVTEIVYKFFGLRIEEKTQRVIFERVRRVKQATKARAKMRIAK